MLSTIATPIPTNFDNVDFEFYVEAFLERWTCANTRRGYRSDIEALTTWCTSHGLEVFKLHRLHLEVFMRYLADERGNSATTIIHRIGTINQFFDLAVEDGLALKNPTKFLKLPKRPSTNAVHRALSSRDYERLVWAAAESTPTDYALVLTMGMCGLRVSAACSLDVETATAMDQAHRLFVFVNKGGETMSVPQPPAVIQAVDRAIDGRTTGPLFRRRDGSRMTRSSALRVIKRLGRSAGITQTIGNHTLRHTFAITSLGAGVPLADVALSMGHKDSSTTFKSYGPKAIANNRHSAYTVAGSIELPTLSR